MKGKFKRKAKPIFKKEWSLRQNKNAIISHENKIYRSKHTKLDSSIKSYFKCINKQTKNKCLITFQLLNERKNTHTNTYEKEKKTNHIHESIRIFGHPKNWKLIWYQYKHTNTHTGNKQTQEFRAYSESYTIQWIHFEKYSGNQKKTKTRKNKRKNTEKSGWSIKQERKVFQFFVFDQMK